MERPPRDELPFLLDEKFDQVDKNRVAQLSTSRSSMSLLGVSLFQDPRSFNTLESGAYSTHRKYYFDTFTLYQEDRTNIPQQGSQMKYESN